MCTCEIQSILTLRCPLGAQSTVSLYFALIHLIPLTGLIQVVLSVQSSVQADHWSPWEKGYMQSKQNVTGLYVILGPQFFHLYDKGFPKIRSWATSGSWLGNIRLLELQSADHWSKNLSMGQTLEKSWPHGGPTVNSTTYFMNGTDPTWRQGLRTYSTYRSFNQKLSGEWL